MLPSKMITVGRTSISKEDSWWGWWTGWLVTSFRLTCQEEDNMCLKSSVFVLFFLNNFEGQSDASLRSDLIFQATYWPIFCIIGYYKTGRIMAYYRSQKYHAQPCAVVVFFLFLRLMCTQVTRDKPEEVRECTEIG